MGGIDTITMLSRLAPVATLLFTAATVASSTPFPHHHPSLARRIGAQGCAAGEYNISDAATQNVFKCLPKHCKTTNPNNGQCPGAAKAADGTAVCNDLAPEMKKGAGTSEQRRHQRVAQRTTMDLSVRETRTVQLRRTVARTSTLNICWSMTKICAGPSRVAC